MQITDETTRELRDAFQLFALAEAMESRPYPKEADWQIVCERAQRHGAPQARSAYKRAIVELECEKLIKLHKAIAVPPPIPLDFEQQIRQMSSTDLRKRLSQDPEHASLFGRFSAGEKPEGFVADEEYQLTAQQWHSLPPAVASVKMRDPKFRKAVDKLIAAGQI